MQGLCEKLELCHRISQQYISHQLYVFNNTRFFTVEVNRRCHIYYNNLSTINIDCSFKIRYLTFIWKGVKLTFSLILNCGLGITLDLTDISLMIRFLSVYQLVWYFVEVLVFIVLICILLRHGWVVKVIFITWCFKIIREVQGLFHNGRCLVLFLSFKIVHSVAYH